MLSKSVLRGAIVALCLISLFGVFGMAKEEYGCHKGYCWTTCIGGVPWWGAEWCYTTKGSSQDFSYIGCTDKSECDKDWKCAGSCTV